MKRNHSKHTTLAALFWIFLAAALLSWMDAGENRRVFAEKNTEHYLIKK